MHFKSRIQFIFSVLAGAFLLHCAASSVPGPSTGPHLPGMTSSSGGVAHADTLPVMAWSFTSVLSTVLTGEQMSMPVDVSGFYEISIIREGSGSGSCGGDGSILWGATADGPWDYRNEPIGTSRPIREVPRAPFVRISTQGSDASCVSRVAILGIRPVTM